MTFVGIIDALATDLSTITFANGYNTDIKRVFKGDIILDDVALSDLPCLAVSLKPNGKITFPALNSFGENIKTVMPIWVTGITKKMTTSTNKYTKINEMDSMSYGMIEDILKGLSSGDWSIFDKVENIEILQSTKVNDLAANIGYIVVELEITFNKTF